MSSIPPPPPLSPPPGYVPYGGVGAAVGRFQTIGGLGKALVILTAISAALNLSLVALQLSLSEKADDPLAVFEDAIAPIALIGLLVLALLVAALVIQIVWAYRMAANLRTLRREGQSFSPGATIAINILGPCTLGILPYFMWRELWKGSNPDSPAGDPNWKRGPVAGILTIWIVASLVAVIAGFSISAGTSVGNFADNQAENLAEQLRDQLGLTLAVGVLQVAVAVIFLVIVRQLTERHMRSTGESGR
jgi:lysylphosphatidylglycerol synthetase-like protein (DUF2156 family)